MTEDSNVAISALSAILTSVSIGHEPVIFILASRIELHNVVQASVL